MLFSSIPFLYYFLPVTLICYFLAPRFAKNTVLLLFSLLFYAWGEPRYVVLMMGTVLIGYFAGLLIEKVKKPLLRKVILTGSLLLCVAGLFYFKYVDFFIENFNRVTGLSIPLLKIALPIGISFYTFQIISYLVDVYRGSTKAQRNLISLAAYIALFAQLIAGPIVRYADIAKQLESRTHSFEKISEGIRRFLIGLSKKILIANVLAELVSAFRGSSEQSVGFFWLYAVCYALHLYFDFSGYSDMAIGLGRIFGFTFLENFDHPFVSKSVTEFWRRWHMSLGSWFRDYVYIPMGGNRVSKGKWYRNILVVWMLTGFWHGADWNFIIWGLLFAILLMIEKAGLLGFLKQHCVISHIYVAFIILISFVIFNAADLSQLGNDLQCMFGFGGLPMWSAETGYYLRSYLVILLGALIGATPAPAAAVRKLKNVMSGKKQEGQHQAGQICWTVLETLFWIALLLLCTAFLVDGSFNPFLYFRF